MNKLRDIPANPMEIEHETRRLLNELEVCQVELKTQNEELQASRRALMDVTERMRIEQELHAAELFAKATIDAVPMHICVLDRTGKILAVNQAWRRFHDQLATGQNYSVGVNYLELCDVAADSGSNESGRIADGIRDVISGRRDQFSMECECHGASDQRWFIARVSRFQGESGNVVLAHEDVTEQTQAERALIELNRDFENFLERTTDFVYFKDREGRFRFCSQTLANVTGHASWRDMIGKRDREVFPACTAHLFQQEEMPILGEGKPLLNKVNSYYDEKGRPGFVQTNKWPLFDEHGNVSGIFGISRDITDQRHHELRLQLAARDELKQANERLMEDIWAREQVEQALHKSEERFRELAELSSDWSWEQDRYFRFTHFSRGTRAPGGAWVPFLLGATRWDQSVDVDAADWAAHLATLEAHRPFKNFEYKRLIPGTPVQWVSTSGNPVFDDDGQFMGYRGTAKDITDRKQAEEALRHSRAELRNLAAHQERVKEDERKRIARDVHDDLGQNLLALRLDVSRMGRRHETCPDSLVVGKAWRDAALSQIDTTIKAVRAIINDLRPAVLDLGLHAAVEWQAKTFEQRSGIACEVYIDHEEFAIEGGLAVALFRIVQESLSNIVRHSRARRTQIEMRREGASLSIRIADDGVGLPADYARSINSFGLIGIEERVYAMGGTFSITSAPGQGMAIMLSIPI